MNKMKWAKSLLCVGLSLGVLTGLCGCSGENAEATPTPRPSDYVSAQEATEIMNQRMFDSIVPPDWEGTTDEYYEYYEEVHGYSPLAELYETIHGEKPTPTVKQDNRDIVGAYYDNENKYLNITTVSGQDDLIVNTDIISHERGSGTMTDNTVSFSIPNGDYVIKGNIVANDSKTVVLTVTESTDPDIEVGMTHTFNR